MKRLIAVLTAGMVDEVVKALVLEGVHGVTLEDTGSGVVSPGDAPRDRWVRLEVVVESHRADDVIEVVEAILDSSRRESPVTPIVVEDVEAVVHIRSGRIFT